MNDESLIQELLYRGEGSTLDYKVKQYPFSGAEDGQKSELLKDILAFANAWRTETAYILIGVKNDTGELVDLDEDIDDSRLQEFINSKTNHPLHFSYRSLEYSGKKLGLYTIQVQERPVYVRRAYGRVMPNVVYVRRGSSTAIADPSEVAKMGAATIRSGSSYAPKLTVKIVCGGSLPSEKISVNYKRYELLAREEYPDYQFDNRRGAATRLMLSIPNRDFYRDLAQYLHEQNGKIEFSLEVTNSGDHFADDVKVSLSAPVAPQFSFKGVDELVLKPDITRSMAVSEATYPALGRLGRGFSVSSDSENVTVKFELGKIQAGESRRTSQVVMLNPPSAMTGLKVRVLSDQLRSPMEISIPSEFNFESEELTFTLLKKLL